MNKEGFYLRVATFAGGAATLLSACGGSAEGNNTPVQEVSDTPTNTATATEVLKTPEATNTPFEVTSTPKPTETPIATPTIAESTPTASPTPDRSGLSGFERFLAENQDFRDAIETLPVNPELIQAMRVPTEHDDNVVFSPEGMPVYGAEMTDVEVVQTFKEHALSFWDEGEDTFLNTPNITNGVVNWIDAMAMIGYWGSSPYLSEEYVDEWQNALNQGVEALGRVENFIADEHKEEHREWLDDNFYSRPSYIDLSVGTVNPDFPALDGIQPVRSSKVTQATR